jgi:hypothetical protein
MANNSIFESMSNELFEYYDYYSLFNSYSSLNSRIDKLLDRCQYYVDLDQVKSSDFIHFLAHTLPKINPKQIPSLSGSSNILFKIICLFILST